MDEKETTTHRMRCTDFNTYLHSRLEETFALYNSYAKNIERNEYASIRRARKALSEVMRLSVLRRKELLDNYKWLKDKKENEL